MTSKEFGQFSVVPKNVLLDLDVSATAIRLYLVLWDHSDREHRSFPSRARLAKMIDRTVRTVDRCMKELVDAGCLRVKRRRADDRNNLTNLYEIVPRVATSMTPPSDISVATPSDISVAQNQTQLEPDNPPTPQREAGHDEVAEVRLRKTEEIGEEDTLAFETAWLSWPRKDGRKNALASFRRSIRLHQIERDQLRAKIIEYGQAYKASREAKFTPMLSTWINGERWNDPLPETPNKVGPKLAPPSKPLEEMTVGERAQYYLKNDPRLQGPW